MDFAAKTIDWLARITAVILGLLMIALQLIYYGANGAANLTALQTILAVFFGLASQVGLFLSPWAIRWQDLPQKIVTVMMLPNVFWLFGQIYYDASEAVEHLNAGQTGEMYAHAIETVVMTLFLAVYVIQIARVSMVFLRKPASNN